jgi:hypothetical protein
MLVLLFTAAFLADWALGLSNPMLRLWFVAFVLGGLGVTLTSLVLPLSRRLEARALAGLVEKRYPELRERLTSAVELSERHQQAHGAEALIATLCAEAADRTAVLDFAPVFSPAPARRRFGLAALLLVLAMVPAFVAPSYAYFGQRFVRCWFAPLVGYQIEVAPAHAALAKGRPATINVRLISEDARVPLPKRCFLLLRGTGDVPTRQAMQALSKATEGETARDFTFTLEKLPGDLVYRIEAGELVSDDHHLTAVDPVELAQGSPEIQVKPPPYVNKEIHPAQTIKESGDFAALQYGTVRFDFRFNRPPVSVNLKVKKQGDHTRNWSEVALDSTQQGAIAVVPTAEVGTFQATLLMEAEHGITTVVALPHWKVWPDEAPVFTRLPHVPAPSAAWSEEDSARPATPRDTIALRATVEDQVGLERLEVEYRINDGASRFEEVAEGRGKLVLDGEAAFSLIGKVKEGDVVRFRLRALDNRRLVRDAVAAGVPERDLGPHVTYEPAPKDGQNRWYTLKITTRTDPLQKQEIAAQRDEVRRLVEAIKKKLQGERTQLEKVNVSAHGQPFLTPETARALGQARTMNKNVVNDLLLLGRKAMDESALLTLAERAFDVADSEMERSDRSLAKAEDKRLEAGSRTQEVKQADQELIQALARLEELDKVNERLAQDRLDQLRMAHLALEQEDLAKRVRDLVAKQAAARGADMHKALKEELALLRAEQDKIAGELARLEEQSQLFSEALQKFRAGQAKRLAQKGRNLAQAQRDLNDAAEQTLLKELKNKLAELARKQDELAGQAEQLGQEAKGKRPEPHFPEAKEAAEALKLAKAVFALQAQEKTQADLARLAGELEHTIFLGKSPREAAMKLAQIQEGIRKDLAQLGERFAALTPKQVRSMLLQILAAQQKLAEAMSRLQIAPDLPAAQIAKAQAHEMVRQGQEYLKTRDGLESYNKLEEALTALRRLAATLPETALANPKESPEELTARQRAQKARGLALKQKELQDAVRKILDDVLEAQKAQQVARHKELEKESDQLTSELMSLAQKSGSLEAMHGAKEAAEAAMDAKKALQQAAMKTAEGNLDQAKEMAKEAALKFDVAAQKADQAAEKMQAEGRSSAENEARDMTGKAFKDGQEQVEKSQAGLKTGPSSETQTAMQRAAKAMQSAAQAAAKQMTKARPTSEQGQSKSLQAGTVGAAPGGQPSAHLLARELEKYPGKSWGELPGELRSRILQDLRGRFGEDYAAVIQQYFQRIADVPANKRLGGTP